MTELTLGSQPPGYRSGFVSLVGRPNVGKSTLLNQMLRTKLAITSDRPQTTRNAVRGVLTTDRAQVVFVDTPGLHKPRTLLGEKLNEVVRRTLRDVDAVVFMLDASQPIGSGDAFLARELAELVTPVVLGLNKTDLLDSHHVDAQVEVARHLGEFTAVVPISARSGAGTVSLVDHVVGVLPEGPLYYPPDMVSDQPERVIAGELIREKLLELMQQEVPHSIAVVVEEITVESDSLTVVNADIYVERDSQKGIVIGKGGRMLKEIGSRARRELEPLLGSRVHLQLRVKVEPDWQKRQALINRFGYGS